VFGTNDKNQIFHPCGLAVCSSETSGDFSFIFRTLHNFDLQWSPKILLVDGSDAITRDFKEVFGAPEVRLMCFFQVRQNLERYFKALPATTSGRLLSDIHALQTCPDEETFHVASELFLKKRDWLIEKDFIEYFRKQWLEKYKSWCEGAARGYSSTNNGIESMNVAIKREHTIRERLPVEQFLQSAAELVQKWSAARNPHSINCSHFAQVRSLSLQHWTTTFQWALANKKVIRSDNEGEGSEDVYYTATSGSKQEASTRMLRTVSVKKGA